jgi:single-strand DNA-binding protein
VQLYEKQAEFASNYIKKGDRVAITGRIQIRKYTDKEGLPKSITEVIGSSIESLESKQRDEKPDRGNEYKATAKGEELPMMSPISDPFDDQ